MGLFKQSRPRGFHHEFMFVDKRKYVLRDIEERAQKSIGMEQKKDLSSREDRIRGAFLNATKYTRRRNERRMSGGFILSTGIILLLIILLVVIWKFLLYI